MKYSGRQIWRAVWISFIIALVLSLLISLILTYFVQFSFERIRVDCGNPPCPMGNGFVFGETFIITFFGSLPIVFLVTLIIYYIVARIRKKGG